MGRGSSGPARGGHDLAWSIGGWAALSREGAGTITRWDGPGGVAARWTGRAEGDLGHGGRYVNAVDPDVDSRRRAVLDRSWTWARQVHGNDVIVVDGAGGRAGRRADALVSATAGAALAVLAADCGPVALASPEGVMGAVHAGWRGLVEGVIERAVEAVRRLGASTVSAAVGPCIRAECYPFSLPDLERVSRRLGDGVQATTTAGAPALDLFAGIGEALRQAGATLVAAAPECTACDPSYFSHRARRERARQALVVWR